MPRYVEGLEIKLTAYDRIFLNAEFFDGVKMQGLEPRRLFPISGLMRYVALLDGEGEQVCIINNVDDLLPDTKKVLLEVLDEYYLIPKIYKIIKREVKYGCYRWTVETSHGLTTFEIWDIIGSIKRLFDDRVLIKDSSDNRYEIPDLNRLDPRSLKLIMPDV